MKILGKNIKKKSPFIVPKTFGKKSKKIVLWSLKEKIKTPLFFGMVRIFQKITFVNERVSAKNLFKFTFIDGKSFKNKFGPSKTIFESHTCWSVVNLESFLKNPWFLVGRSFKKLELIFSENSGVTITTCIDGRVYGKIKKNRRLPIEVSLERKFFKKFAFIDRRVSWKNLGLSIQWFLRKIFKKV